MKFLRICYWQHIMLSLSLFVVFVNTVGIAMCSNCVPVLADMFFNMPWRRRQAKASKGGKKGFPDPLISAIDI